MATQRQIQANAVPVDEEWFFLEIDNDCDPMEVVMSSGLKKDGWKYLGPKFRGKRTCRAKLVRLGYVRNRNQAIKKASERGFRLAEGQAREPFKAKFPESDGKGYVIFGGSEWEEPRGHATVVCLYGPKSKWRLGFNWSTEGFGKSCRWLVVEP